MYLNDGFFSGKVVYLVRKIQFWCQGSEGLQRLLFPIIIFYCFYYLLDYTLTWKTMHSEQNLFFLFKKKAHAYILKWNFPPDRLISSTAILPQILKEL